MTKPPDQQELERICRHLGTAFDDALQEATKSSGRRLGFLLMMFDFGEGGFNAYFSNADRRDVVNLLKEQIEHLENE